MKDTTKKRRISIIGIAIMFGLMVILGLILAISCVSAVPPVTQTGQVASLDIAYPQYQYVKLNSSFTLYIHVYNSTQYITGGLADCYLDLYNPMGEETCHSLMTAGTSNYYVTVTNGNFSMLGQNSFIIQCNTSSQAGFANGIFEVTRGGNATAGDNVEIFFFIVFMIMIAVMLITLMNIVEGFVNFKTTFYDVAYSMSIYFGVLALYSFNIDYFGNQLIYDISSMFVDWGALTHIFLPIVSLVVSLIFGGVKKGLSQGQTYG